MKRLLIITVLLFGSNSGADTIAKPSPGTRYTCQTSAPAPINTAREWLRCSDGELVRTTSNNLDIVVSKYYNVVDFGAKGDGVTDNSAAIQAAINAAQSDTFHKTVYIPGGEYNVNSTLFITGQGLRFVGDRHGRPTNGGALTTGGTRLKYEGASGALFQIGTDDGNPWDANEYNGVQSTEFSYLSMKYFGNSITPLDNGLGNYGTNITAIQDWRGGDVNLDHVTIEYFGYGFWGIQSDVNHFVHVEFNYNHIGMYFGPRSDQLVMTAYYGFNNDIAVYNDSAETMRISDSTFVNDGWHDVDYPITIHSTFQRNQGAANHPIGFTCDRCWFEHFIGADWVDAWVSVGDTDSISSWDIRIINPTIFTNPQGGGSGSYTKYFAKMDHADRVIVMFPSGYFNNLAKMWRFTGTGSPNVFFDTMASYTFVGTSSFQNDGTGTPNIWGQSSSSMLFPGGSQFNGAIAFGNNVNMTTGSTGIVDLSASSGTWKTPTGQGTIGGTVTINGALIENGSEKRKRMTLGDQDHTVGAAEFNFAYTTNFTGAHTLSIDCTAIGTSGQPQYFSAKDETGTASGTNTITIIPSAGKIDNATSKVCINSAFGSCRWYSNGTNCFMAP